MVHCSNIQRECATEDMKRRSQSNGRTVEHARTSLQVELKDHGLCVLLPDIGPAHLELERFKILCELNPNMLLISSVKQI
jgi:hypothetical protein